MMKKIYKITGLVLLMALMVAGCSKFEDINTNPNTTTAASASMLCTKGILSVTAFSGRDGKVMISDNALPKYVGYANEGQLGTQYNTIGATDFSGLLVLPNLDQMLKEAEGTVMENSYRGVAGFVRAYLFFRLTMETGDIPFSETNRGDEGLYRPGYDTQEEIFIGILDELKAADQYFASGVTGISMKNNIFALYQVRTNISSVVGNTFLLFFFRRNIFNRGNIFS